MQTALPKSIVFITGTFISHTCWNEWTVYFENEGYKCIAPAWPHKDATAEELRNRPDPIALNSIESVTDYFAAIIGLLPEKPILVGHSLGGLVVQLLLQRNLGSAGIAMNSFPPRGVSRFRLSFIKAVWETMLLFSSDRPTYLIPFSKWKYAIVNGLTYEQQKELYYKYAIPESKKIITQVFKCAALTDRRKLRVPLLLTAGSNDKLVPPSLNYRNYKQYSAGNAIVDYRNFKRQNHLVFGYPGWKRTADFIIYWLQGLR